MGCRWDILATMALTLALGILELGGLLWFT